MNSLRNDPIFKVVALVLGVCFAVFAFHFVAHLEHAFEEESHTCPVCQALAVFALLVLFAFSLQRLLQKVTFFQPQLLFYYQSRFFPSLVGRAPPLFS